jgi:hypothetical protein
MVRWYIRKQTKREKLNDTMYGTVYREYTTREKVLQFMDSEGNWVDVETVEENENGS